MNVLIENYKDLRTDAPNRRSILIKEMERLSNEDKNCQQCDGRCCTFSSNSMKITAVETFDLYYYLKLEKRWTLELKSTLESCVTDFRLDKFLDDGQGISFRRTYTCPFFSPGSRGCSISRKYKPYGCLGFNAKSSNAKGGESCLSNIDILSLQNDELDEEIDFFNKKFSEKYIDFGDKQSIPIALLFLSTISEQFQFS